MSRGPLREIGSGIGKLQAVDRGGEEEANFR